MSSESEDAIEINSDDMVPMTTESRPLIPESIEDEKDGVEHFVEVFKERYLQETDYIPPFYRNNLEETVKDATNGKYSKRRPLALYLHDDKSHFSHIFCTKILCSQPVSEFFHHNNFVIWPWDVTIPRHKSDFFSTLSRKVGTSSAAQIKVIPADRYPVIIVLHKYHGVIEVITVIYGDAILTEAFSQLLSAHEMFNDQIEKDKEAETARMLRRQIREEQDEAYEDSLRQDEEKARKRLEQENEREAQAKRLKLEQEESEKQRGIERSAAEKRVPLEPDEEDTENVITVRFRIPKSSQKEQRCFVQSRRFHADNLCKHVFDYAWSLGYPISEYKLITTYPRTDITMNEPHKTLKDIGLSRQETINVEKR